MNTNSINTISKYLLLFLLILTGASCNDNDDAEDTSIPVLISQNINDGDVVGPPCILVGDKQTIIQSKAVFTVYQGFCLSVFT